MTSTRIRLPILVCALVLLSLSSAGAADAQQSQAHRTGEELFHFACAACHGADGTGAPRSQLGFDDPIPDFTDCSFNTPEAAADWIAVAHQGGPVRAFSRRMPAFGEALTAVEIERTVDYVRSLCDDPAWPRGDLNFPRALMTEKAFPENETLFTTTIQTGDSREFTNEVVYERRFGARNQFEVAVPLAMQASEGEQWFRGVGAIAVAVKRVLFHSMNTGTILSTGGEVVLPTGRESESFGRGIMKFEPFLLVGQVLRGNAFVQAQVGAEIPRLREHADEVFWRGVVGTTVMQGGFGRSWTPMLEFAGVRELERGSPVEWDVLPQMQVSLSKRQHILVAAGVRIPVTQRDGRPAQLLTYLLWDWFDGGFRDGWR